MLISTKGRYALRVVLDLAQHAGDGYVSLKSVAERQDVSVKYLESIVALLQKGGVLTSQRGTQVKLSLERLSPRLPRLRALCLRDRPPYRRLARSRHLPGGF